jgi:hypothetical protein
MCNLPINILYSYQRLYSGKSCRSLDALLNNSLASKLEMGRKSFCGMIYGILRVVFLINLVSEPFMMLGDLLVLKFHQSFETITGIGLVPDLKTWYLS